MKHNIAGIAFLSEIEHEALWIFLKPIKIGFIGILEFDHLWVAPPITNFSKMSKNSGS